MPFQTLLRNLFRRVSRPTTFFFIAASIAITGLAASMWVPFASVAKVEASASPRVKAAVQALPQDNSPREKVGAEVIRLTPNGFEPSEITRPKGRFILHVENRTVLTDISLTLRREAGDSEREARLVKRRKWAELIDLSPGRYILKEASHPSWTCQITITPQ